MDMETLQIFLGPTITLIVGGFAIGIYFKQKIEKKRNAAQLILQEIRYAEQIIRNARTQSIGNFSLCDKLLPTNSWHENIHLFIKELKEPQIDLISRFYSEAQYLDVVIRSISDKKCREDGAPSNNVQIPNIVISQDHSSPASRTALEIPPNFMANLILEDVTNRVELIYNSPAVEKLMKISQKKVWLVF